MHLQTTEYNQPIQSHSISQLITWNRQLKPVPDGFCTLQTVFKNPHSILT